MITKIIMFCIGIVSFLACSSSGVYAVGVCIYKENAVEACKKQWAYNTRYGVRDENDTNGYCVSPRFDFSSCSGQVDVIDSNTQNQNLTNLEQKLTAVIDQLKRNIKSLSDANDALTARLNAQEKKNPVP